MGNDEPGSAEECDGASGDGDGLAGTGAPGRANHRFDRLLGRSFLLTGRHHASARSGDPFEQLRLGNRRGKRSPGAADCIGALRSRCEGRRSARGRSDSPVGSPWRCVPGPGARPAGAESCRVLHQLVQSPPAVPVAVRAVSHQPVRGVRQELAAARPHQHELLGRATAGQFHFQSEVNRPASTQLPQSRRQRRTPVRRSGFGPRYAVQKSGPPRHSDGSRSANRGRR